MTPPAMNAPEYRPWIGRQLRRLAVIVPISAVTGATIGWLLVVCTEPDPATAPPAEVTVSVDQAVANVGSVWEAADLTSWCNRYQTANDGQLSLRYGDTAQLPWLLQLAQDGTTQRHAPLHAPSLELWAVLDAANNAEPLDVAALDTAARGLTSACEAGHLALLGTEWGPDGWTIPEEAS